MILKLVIIVYFWRIRSFREGGAGDLLKRL
jgi:hypothetical protein